MPWHVAKGRYFMAYDPNMEPYDMVGKTGQEHSLVMVVHIDYGLMGRGLDCRGDQTAGNDEVHYSVDGTTFVMVLRWKDNERVFLNGGTGRLYFDSTVTAEQKLLLEETFQEKPTDDLQAFSRITTWLPSDELGGVIAGVGPITTASIDITVPASTAGPLYGGLNLRPRRNRFRQGENHRLINGDPNFRMGGQNPDLQGVTLASTATAAGMSAWADNTFIGFKGAIDLSGQGEARAFEWQGTDVVGGKPILMPSYLTATGLAERQREVREELLRPLAPFNPDAPDPVD
jgi:hypothetical protein